MKNIIMVITLSLLIFTGCKGTGDDDANVNSDTSSKVSQHGDHEDEVVAVVNGKTIYRSDLKNTTLDNAIRDELIYQEAVKKGIDKEIRDEVEQFRRNLMIRVLKDRIINEESHVTEEDIRAYYDKNRGDYISVLIKELIIKDGKIAEEAYRRAASGEDFEKLTEEYKADRKAHAHGHVKVDPPYMDMFLAKEEGAVEMFEHPEGMKIAKLAEKHEIPFSTVSKIIKAKLKGKSGIEKLNRTIEEIRDQSEIKIVSETSSAHGSDSHSADHQEHGHHNMSKAGFTKEQFLEDAAECLKIPHSFERTECFQPYFNYVTHKKSAYYTLQLAKVLEDEGTIRDCHMVAHHTGMAVLQKNDFDVKKAFAECTPDCVQGCYHAVLENYVSHAKWKPEEIALKGTALCNEISQGDKLKNRQCIHGVGHGMVKNHYMPVQKAAGICRELSGTVRLDACLGGVFMEHANRMILPAGEEEMPELLPSVCEIELEDEILKEICARAVGEGVMFYTGHDLDKSRELCKHLNKKEYGPCVEAATEMDNASE